MSHADALALLDIEGSERFVLSEYHEDLVPAADLPYDVVARCLTDPLEFMRHVAPDREVPWRAVPVLQASWRAQQGLVDGDDLQRLLWTVGHFSRELEVDLLQHVGVRLGDLWAKRQWRLLLNLLDRLPRATWTWQAMSNHPEYADRIAARLAERALKADPDEDTGTPLMEYTPTVAALAGVVDAVNAMRSVLMQVNAKSGTAPPVIPPYPRPKSLVDTMVAKKEREMRWAAHESLASRLLSRQPTEGGAG